MFQKTILFVSIFCVSFFVQAQEKVMELPDSFSYRFYTKKHSYSISNQNNGDVMLLLEEGKQFQAYLLNSNYEEKSKVATKTISSKYDQIIGYNITGNTYSVFFSNSRHTKFGVQVFDFENKTSKINIIDFKIKGEIYLESINYNNKLLVLTITRNSSDLNIYTFDQNAFKKKTLSLKELEYKNDKNQRYSINAFDLLISYSGGFSNSIVNLIKIESSNPNIIETTSEENKLYQYNDQLIFSFDKDDKKTRLCYIDLERFIPVIKTYDKPANTEEGYRKSNSYIFENKLFQIASSNQKMKFTVLDLQTEQIIKEYKITKNDSIPFKNSPIIQEGGGMFPEFSGDRVREMEKTSKYLRKISSANLGISVYKINNTYNIILGGTKEITTGGGGFVGAPGFGGGADVGATIGSTGAFVVGFNPTFYGYNGYTSTKSTYINCLFDDTFNHIPGDIPLNSFDYINDFEDKLDKPKAINIFRHQQKLHYGYFDIKDKKYNLYKFQQ